LGKHPFPGCRAGIAALSRWLDDIHGCYKTQLEEDFHMTASPETPEVASRVLLENAPEKVYVKIQLCRKDLEDHRQLHPPARFSGVGVRVR